MSDYWRRQAWSRRSVVRGGLIGGVGLASAALIGCSAAGTKTPAGGTSAPSSSGGTAAGGDQPQMSDAFIAVQTRDAPSLEPLDANVYTIPERVGLVNPRLIYTDRDPKNPDSADIRWIPSYITEGWEAQNAGAQLTFKLRKGVKYTNIAPLNGREFTSADVKYSINRYMTNPKSTFKSRFDDISSVETPDNYTVVVKMKAPSRYIYWALAAETCLITPPETDDKADGYKKVAIGPGPYIHDKYLQGEGSKLHKNPDFIDAKKIWYQNFNFKVVTDAATRDAATKTQQVDYGIGAVGPAELKAIDGPAITKYPAPVSGASNISWNLNNPKFKDIRARLAMSKAIDRDQMIGEVYQNVGSWNGIVPVGFGKWAIQPDDLKQINAYKFDAAEARKLWDAAGKPAPTIEMWFNSNGTTGKLQAELNARQWETVLGIKSTLKTEDYSIYLPKMYLGAGAPGGGYSDVWQTVYGVPHWMENLTAPYLVGGNRNSTGYKDQKTEDMIADLRRTLDDKAAVEKSLAIQKYLMNETLPMTQMPAAVNTGVFNSKLRNFVPGVYPPGMEWMIYSWKVK